MGVGCRNSVIPLLNPSGSQAVNANKANNNRREIEAKVAESSRFENRDSTLQITKMMAK